MSYLIETNLILKISTELSKNILFEFQFDQKPVSNQFQQKRFPSPRFRLFVEKLVAAADRNCTKTVLEASALDEITDDLKELKVSDRRQDDQITELRKEVQTLTTAAEKEVLEAAPMNMITSRSIADG